MIKLIHNLKMKYSKSYRISQQRKELSDRLKNYEVAKKEKDEWRATPEVMIGLIDLIDFELLKFENPNILKSFKCYTGLTSVSHMFNWISSIEFTVKSTDPITTDLIDFRFKRKEKTLYDFLSVQNKLVVDIPDILLKLKEVLINLDKTINNSGDGIYRTMVNRTLSENYRDIFVFIETVITLALEERDEQ